MKKILALAIAVFVSSNAFAGFTAANGYNTDIIYDSGSTYSIVEGLAKEGQNLYFGSYTSINSLNVESKAVTSVGTIPSNAGIAYTAYNNGNVYASYGTSYSSPFPYKAGYINSTGNYVNQLNMDGIFDIAINSAGQAYILSNPGALGSQVYSYNWTTGAVSNVATLGGYSGGIAFDSQNNLYFADQTSGDIVKFTSTQIASGNLTINDAQSVVSSIWASYLCFDGQDNLVATSGYAASSKVAKYDISTGSKIADLGYGSGALGKVLWDNNTLYIVETDYNAWASTINAVTTPEPATIAILAFGYAAILRRKR